MDSDLRAQPPRDRLGRPLIYSTDAEGSGGIGGCVAPVVDADGLADDATDVAVASVLIGAGNGVTSGAVLTLGADLAPEGEEGPYLAGFTLVSNLGLFLGPLVVGAVADVAGLDVSAFVLGGMLLAGVAWIAFVIGETGRPSNPTPGEARQARSA